MKPLEPGPWEGDSKPVKKLKDHIHKEYQEVELFAVEWVILIKKVSITRDFNFIGQFIVNTYK